MNPLNLTPGEPPSPWLLNYTSAINGFTTRSLRDGFTYCEIGVADGSDLLFLAASNPAGRFFGIQTNGASLVTAGVLQLATGIGNCAFHERTLADLGGLDIPPIDFMVLKGGLSRDDPEARRSALSFIARHLKPGGLILCSYRTPHAWAFWEPVLHFLRAAAQAPGDREENIKRGLGELQTLREAGAALFQISPLMPAILESIGAFDLQSLDRALLQTPNPALHFDEVCADMAGVGLGYAGGLPLSTNYPQICLPAKLKERFASLPGLRLRETWKDLVRMPFFRQDIFTSADRTDRPELPEEMVLGSHRPRNQFSFDFDIPEASPIRLDGPLFQGLADLLAENALTLAAILSSPALKAFSATDIVSSLAWMTAMEQIRPFASEVPDIEAFAFRLSRFNLEVLHQQLAGHGGDVRLASRTLGNGLDINARQALALLALSEAGPENAEEWAGRWLVNHALPGENASSAPCLGQIIQQLRARPNSLAVLGVTETRCSI